jgi:hypothetical protein
VETLNDCPNEDLLLRVGSAVDWKVDGVLQHIGSCDACAATLRDLRTLDLVLATSTPPDPGFTDEVMRAIEAEGAGSTAFAPTAARDRRRDVVVKFLCATMIAFLVLVASATMQGESRILLAPATAVAVAAGLVVAALDGGWRRGPSGWRAAEIG